MRNLRLIPLTLLLALSAALGGPGPKLGPKHPVTEGRGAKTEANRRPGEPASRATIHENFRVDLERGDAEAAASHLQDIYDKEWTRDTQQRVVSELKERIRNQPSQERQAPWIAMEKAAVFESVYPVRIDGELRSKITLNDPDLGTPSLSDMQWMTIYATADTGLSGVDPGPSLRNAVVAGQRSGRLSARTIEHEDLATATPDLLVIRENGAEHGLRRKSEEHFDWMHPEAKCDNCRVLVVVPGGQ